MHKPPPPPPKRVVQPRDRPTRPGALRVGSLFSGIAGLELGLHWAAESLGLHADVAFFCERDPYATSVLNRHFPGVPVLTDVRKVRVDEVGEVDVLAGGFPCQPFSTAGARRGQDDERFLWPECVRLMRELKPTVAIWENVPGLQNIAGVAGDDTTRGHVFKRVLDDATAAGYRVEWDHVPASAVGAWHRRDRLFIVCRRDNVEAWGGVAETAFGLPIRLWGDFGPLEWPRAGTRRGTAHYSRTPRYPLAGNGAEPWPTPMVGGGGGTLRGGSGAPADLEQRLRTPIVPDARQGRRKPGTSAGYVMLAEQAHLPPAPPPKRLVPTPTAADADGGRTTKGGSDLPSSLNAEVRGLRAAALARREFPTPGAFDQFPWRPESHEERAASGKQMMLAHAVGKLEYPSPTASGGLRGGVNSSNAFIARAEDPDEARRMVGQRMEFPTPTAGSGGIRPNAGTDANPYAGQSLSVVAGRRLEFPTPTAFEGNSTTDPSETWHVPLRDAAMRASGADPGKSTPDPVLAGGMLNPDWVEWLMAFPIGWTVPPLATAARLYGHVADAVMDLVGLEYPGVAADNKPPAMVDVPPLGWDYEPAIPRLTLVEDHRPDRLRCCGNAVVPRVACEVMSRALRGVKPKPRS